MDGSAPKKRIPILGGGFGGVSTARHLERLFRRQPDVVKVGLDSETALLLREVAVGDATA
jgi:NADH dehydrogenase FAD-containing subunit